jgi:hypothetical protein
MDDAATDAATMESTARRSTGNVINREPRNRDRIPLTAASA